MIQWLTGRFVGPGIADVDALAVRGGPVICDSVGVDQARYREAEACQGTYPVCLRAQGSEVPTAKAEYTRNESCFADDPDCPYRLPNCYVQGIVSLLSPSPET